MAFNFGAPSSTPTSGDQAKPNTSTTTPGSSFASSGAPSFSFGNVGSTSAFGAPKLSAPTSKPGGLFGNTGSSAAGNTQQSPGSGLFGSNVATTATPPGGMFGQANSTAAGGGTPLFGGTGPANLSSTAAGNKNVGSSSIFGGAAGAGISGAAASTSAPTSLIFGQQKPLQAANAGAANTSSPFAQTSLGGAPTVVFGNNQTSNTNAGTTASNQATPSKPVFSLSSTTPAGAPPANNGSATSGSTPAGVQAKPLFGGSTTGQQSSSSPFSSAGGSAPSVTAPQPSTTTAPLLFGNKEGSGAAKLFGTGQTPAAAPSLLFGNQSAPGQPAPTPATATPGLFGQSKTTSAPAAPSLLGSAPPLTASSSNPSGTTDPPKTFGNLAASMQFPTPATSAPSSGLFAAAATTTKPAATFGQPATTASQTPAATAAPATSVPASSATTTTTSGTSSLFQPTTTTAPASKDATTAPSGTTTTANPLGASTKGPPSQLPRLKNKSMDDILTRWASDLSKYQKEFKDQASKVAEWDRLLVESGERIQRLYLNTYEAERASNEIEKQLMAVESQQDELENWLDRYEADVQEMVSRQYGPGDQLGGPDQERERTYKLAEKLSQHLDEKNRDLSKMVKEINDISDTLSKSNKGEDPVSQIVRILNGHLAQLQWIDTNAAALQAKVLAAQKASNGMGNNYNISDNDAAESFYRSYMGRR